MRRLLATVALSGCLWCLYSLGAPPRQTPLQLTDITQPAGIRFVHNNGAFGKKYLPETLGPGCAFLDFDQDGWPDLFLANGRDWPEHHERVTTPALYRNNRNGTFSDVTRAAGLANEMYGMGAAAADFNNDGFPDLYLTAYGQNRLFQNNGHGGFLDVTERAGLGGRQSLSTSALWFDYDRDGRLDLFVANYVRWTPALDVFCSLDGKHKSYCTPEAYRGAASWLFHNLGGGRFADVTAKAGLLDTSAKSLGVAMLDYDADGWPDLFVANDTQPNKLYRNQHDGTFEEIAVRAGIALSEDGKARAGMGVDTAYLGPRERPALAISNFDNEMLALYRAPNGEAYADQALRTALGRLTRRRLGFGLFFWDVDLDGRLDLLLANGHIDDTVRNLGRDSSFAQPPQLFLQEASGQFSDVAGIVGGGFSTPKVGRGAAYADIDGDGDLDCLLTANNGPVFLYRNDVRSGAQGVRFRLRGTRSNRDAIGALVRIAYSGGAAQQMVKTGSSYLSQSELVLTFGLGQVKRVDLAEVIWPDGHKEQTKNLTVGKTYVWEEGKGVQ